MTKYIECDGCKAIKMVEQHVMKDEVIQRHYWKDGGCTGDGQPFDLCGGCAARVEKLLETFVSEYKTKVTMADN